MKIVSPSKHFWSYLKNFYHGKQSRHGKWASSIIKLQWNRRHRGQRTVPTSVREMSFAFYFRLLNQQRVASHFTVFSSTLFSSPAHLPSSVFADCCLSFFTLFILYPCIHLHPHYRALPVFHSDLQWEEMWGWSDIRHDHYPFPRSSLDPSSRPKFSHLHPRPLLLPFTLKCSSDSRCSDNCSGMTVFHPNPQTCCHGNWALQIAPRHIQPPLTWNMNDEFEVLCACVCPWMCARGGQWTDFSS